MQQSKQSVVQCCFPTRYLLLEEEEYEVIEHCYPSMLNFWEIKDGIYFVFHLLLVVDVPRSSVEMRKCAAGVVELFGSNPLLICCAVLCVVCVTTVCVLFVCVLYRCAAVPTCTLYAHT